MPSKRVEKPDSKDQDESFSDIIKRDFPNENLSDANFENLVSIARQLRNLSVDLGQWGTHESDELYRDGLEMPTSPFTDCIDDSIFHLASSSDYHPSPRRRIPWTLPLRHSYKHDHVSHLALPESLGDDVLRKGPYRNHLYDAITRREDQLVESQPLDKNRQSHFSDHFGEVPPYEKLLSILTFPIDLRETVKGLERLHEKYMKPILQISSDKISMMHTLETERNKLIEKIIQLEAMSNGTLTDELNKVYHENKENTALTLSKLIDPTSRDTRSVMLSMAIHLQIFAACLIDIAHTIVSAEVTNRVRMQFFKRIDEAERSLKTDSVEASHFFNDIPTFDKSLGMFAGLVTKQDFENLLKSTTKMTDKGFHLRADAFLDLEHLIEGIDFQLHKDFYEFRESHPEEGKPKQPGISLFRGSPLSSFFDGGGINLPKIHKTIENQHFTEIKDILQEGADSYAERAMADYFCWLHRHREDAGPDEMKDRGEWLTYANVHDFLHGGKLEDFPLIERQDLLEKRTEKPVERTETGEQSPSLPLFLPPTLVNAATRVDKEPRSMTTLIENIQITRSKPLQESFAGKILKILNHPELDADALGIVDEAAEHDKKFEEIEETKAIEGKDCGSCTPESSEKSPKKDPHILWPTLFLAIPQDRIRKAFEHAYKPRPSSTISEKPAFPNHLEWIHPTPETSSPKTLLQSFFRIGLEKIIQVLEKNRLMSDSILLPRQFGDDGIKRLPSADAKKKDLDLIGKPVTSVLTHFSCNPDDQLKDGFYAPPTKQHLLDQLEWNFTGILQKSADIYKCLAFGAGAIKGHRIFSRSDLDSIVDDHSRRSGRDGNRSHESDGKYAPPTLDNLRELYEQVYVIGLQHCLQQMRPRLLKQVYNDIFNNSTSDTSSREEASAEKQIQFIITRIFPREETRLAQTSEGKTCQCHSSSRELQYQCIGSWIFVPSVMAAEIESSLAPDSHKNQILSHGLEDALTGKIRMRLRGLHLLRSLSSGEFSSDERCGGFSWSLFCGISFSESSASTSNPTASSSSTIFCSCSSSNSPLQICGSCGTAFRRSSGLLVGSVYLRVISVSMFSGSADKTGFNDFIFSCVISSSTISPS